MTRKDYNLIADAFAGTRPNTGISAETYVQWLYDVQTMATALRGTNPAFDRARFLTACGVK